MVAEFIAVTAKRKFIYKLKNSIPETGDFKAIKCFAIDPKGYKICIELFSVCSGDKRAITFTAEKDGCSNTKNLLSGTNSEVLEWLEKRDKKEFAKIINEVKVGCTNFYYP